MKESIKPEPWTKPRTVMFLVALHRAAKACAIVCVYRRAVRTPYRSEIQLTVFKDDAGRKCFMGVGGVLINPRPHAQRQERSFEFKLT